MLARRILDVYHARSRLLSYFSHAMPLIHEPHFDATPLEKDLSAYAFPPDAARPDALGSVCVSRIRAHVAHQRSPITPTAFSLSPPETLDFRAPPIFHAAPESHALSHAGRQQPPPRQPPPGLL